jgi:hypothetical protein
MAACALLLYPFTPEKPKAHVEGRGDDNLAATSKLCGSPGRYGTSLAFPVCEVP